MFAMFFKKVSHVHTVNVAKRVTNTQSDPTHERTEACRTVAVMPQHEAPLYADRST